MARKVLLSPAFPRAVVATQRNRLWIRSDVEAFARGEPFPERKENELRDLYLTSEEVVQLTGVRPSTVNRSHRGVPPPAVALGSVFFWLRSEVETFVPSRARA